VSPEMCCFDARHWLSEKVKWPGSLDASLCEEHRRALRDFDRKTPIPQPVLSPSESKREGMDCGTWPREPCLPRRMPDQRDERASACRFHTG